MAGQIAVLGSGVAGMAAARRLSLQGHRALLIAPDSVVESRGETLSDKALPLLDALGWSHLLDQDVALRCDGRFSVWGDSRLRRAALDERSGHHLDRQRFETAMSSAFAGNDLERLRTSARALAHVESGVIVSLADGTVRTAAAVIDCTGRTALSSGPAAERRRIDRLTAAWRVIELPDGAETMAATLVEAVQAGWWYTAAMPQHRVMIGYFTDSDLLPRSLSRNGAAFRALMADAAMTSARLESLGLLEMLAALPPQLSPASSVTSARLVEGLIVRAGDAAAALDPLGANGLTTALWSGMQAAQAALALIAGDPEPAHAYEYAYHAGIANHLTAQSAFYASENRFSNAPFWARRVSTAPG